MLDVIINLPCMLPKLQLSVIKLSLVVRIAEAVFTGEQPIGMRKMELFTRL